MRTQPLESSIMLAGLTRGLWTGAPADRHAECHVSSADAASWRSALLADAEMPDVGDEDRANGSAATPSDW